MNPQIASLHDRMSRGGDWMTFRKEIATLNGEARTQAEFVALLEAHSNLVALAEHCFDAATCTEIRRVAFGEYKMFLNVEAMESGQINPMLLDGITAREVEAGRLAANDSFRLLAKSAALLGDGGKSGWSNKIGNRIAMAAVIGAGVCYLITTRLEALWIIPAGVLVGWAFNERERRRWSVVVDEERAARGY